MHLRWVAFTCALLSDATVRCWGVILPEAVGEIDSEGNIIGRTTPVVVEGFGEVVELEGGYGHLCARLRDSTVRCLGANMNGQLGDGTRTHRNMPVSVFGMSAAAEISVGGITCARLENGTVQCWGMTDNSVRTTPEPVMGLSEAVEIDVGGWQGCARLDDGTVRCWGYNGDGQATAGGCCHEGVCGIPSGTACGTTGGTCSDDGWCAECGGPGQACCDRLSPPGRICRSETPLCTDDGVCAACGGLQERCCGPTNSCDDAGAVCFADRCVKPGEPGRSVS